MKLTDRSLELPWIIIHRMGPVPIPFVFPLAPQRIHWSFPSRTNIDQTLLDNVVNDFSGPRSILAAVQMQGTFGYDPVRGGAFGLSAHGSVHLKALETIYETFNALDRQLKRDKGASQELAILSRLQLWQVLIKNLEYDMRSESPLIYAYSLTIVRVQDYLSPVGPSLPTSIPGVNVPAASAIAGLF